METVAFVVAYYWLKKIIQTEKVFLALIIFIISAEEKFYFPISFSVSRRVMEKTLRKKQKTAVL